MGRPVKWSRGLHPIWERATNSKTETWGRTDIEDLFDVGRATAQTLMKAVGEIQPVGGAHFVERAALLSFLDAMIAAPDVDQAYRLRLAEADSPPRPRPLRITMPSDLRHVTVKDLKESILLGRGRLEIAANTVEELVECLVEFARVLQDDPDGVRTQIEGEKAPPQVEDDEIRAMFAHLRKMQEERRSTPNR
jgi:hypothetical protein